MSIIKLDNTKAVLNKTLEDFGMLCFWIHVFVQVVFLGLYGYKIYTNIDRLIFLVIYVVLAVLSIVLFCIFLSTYKIRKNKTVKKTKRIFRLSKYVVNACMLVVVYLEMFKYGTSDFNKVITIFSTVAFCLQIIIEIGRLLFERYSNLFVYAFNMDIQPVMDITQKIKDPTGTILSAIDYFPNKFVNGKNKTQEQEQVEELNETEKKIRSLTDKYKKGKADKNTNSINELREKHKKQKEEIKQHLRDIVKFKKDNKKEK